MDGNDTNLLPEPCVEIKKENDMIIDNIKNKALYENLGIGIETALRYLAQTDFSGMAPGRYDIDGDKMYALVQQYETRPHDKGQWEAHRRYIDVQYVDAGIETMGYAPIDTMMISQAYTQENDCALFAGKGDFFTVRDKTFVVFFPGDVHMPCLINNTPGLVRKVVVKVAVDHENH